MDTALEKLLSLIKEGRDLAKIDSFDELNNIIISFSSFTLSVQEKINYLLKTFNHMNIDTHLWLPDSPTEKELAAYNFFILLEDIEYELLNVLWDLEDYKALATDIEKVLT